MRVQLGPLSAELVGGTDRKGGGDGPLVVLLHGFGAPGEDLVGLHRVMDVPREVRFAFPAAPLELPMGYGDARAWWLIDMIALERAMQTGTHREMASVIPDGLAEARQMVREALSVLQRDHGATPDRTILGGFSQGAMLSLDVALHRAIDDEAPFAGLVLFSPTLIAAELWRPAMAKLGAPIMVSHGSQDPILPFAASEGLRDELRAAGLEVDWLEFRGGHAIPQQVLEKASSFIRRRAK